MSVRRRKLELQDEGSPTAPRRVKVYGPSRSQKRCLVYSTIFLLITLVFGYLLILLSTSHKTGAIDSILLTLGLHKSVYAIVIDAGSTGSRVLALSFHQSLLDSSLKLDDELFVEVMPGLSAYAAEPHKAKEQIEILLEKAETFIPEKYWSSTPLVLRATAGLRLLPEEQANELLHQVRILFEESPFHTTDNSVAIMDGSDEGLFAWVNVNFLLDRLFGEPRQMLVALDLGGGSTQITFPLISEKEHSQYSSEDVHPMQMFGHKLFVYSHSYLGLGLNAARKEILLHGNPTGATHLASECVNPIIKNKSLTYAGVEYKVSGPLNPEVLKKKRKNIEGGVEETPIVRVKECSDIIKNYISRQNMLKPTELQNFEIIAFSYFFDRATEVGLIDPFTGGTVTLKDLKREATNSCLDPNVDRPFMCVDLLFITILLEDGYGMTPDTKIKIVKRIDGHEVSWSLGAAFHILQNGV
ncbi:ectonucleoside triphosphate diphosphohydrolase 5 isoform X2 [Macrosteles quadrilineatus]|uniref:ectonucleoside triphosphate diphosphohydrolase 5 isoform X2 n=1 Tax=Macrosteles quadrilineatus TaxID=74068 RepID=UPI0023E2EEA6|nr:ectonucleoside triphosphate diphosphohydrolase 5 isoform X2 [Macrosteles quadrilineatus]